MSNPAIFRGADVQRVLPEKSPDGGIGRELRVAW